MKRLTTTLLILGASLFLGCDSGDHTEKSIIPDVKSIHITSDVENIYATDNTQELFASATYDDNATVDVEDEIRWTSSNTSAITVLLNTIVATKSNDGDANISINYRDTFSDMIHVNVISLVDYNITNISGDVNATGSYQFKAVGTFEDNQTKTIQNHLVWTTTNGATVEVVDSIATITLVSGETNITATLFEITDINDSLAPQTLTYTLD